MTTIVTNWLESGLTQVKFARNHDLKIATLPYWIAKRQKSTVQHTDFIQLPELFSQGILIRYAGEIDANLISIMT
ncbi:MAG: hypothetical protein JXA23_02800, partial [Bacteroidales bacterium]|nr:hypothetical protein [Bacteroidales bacterium]